MYSVDPKTPLLALGGAPIRRVAADWRDALRTVDALATQHPGAPLSKVIESAATLIGNAEGSGMTLGDAMTDALLTGKGAEECAGKEKLRRWELALGFRAGEPVDLLPEDLLFIDTCLAAIFKAAVYGPARDALYGVTR